MQRMVKSYGIGRVLYEEAPSGLVAFAVAELLYKFGSFALECLAFLGTWYALSWAASVVGDRMRRDRAQGAARDER